MRWVKEIAELSRQYKTQDILDYGCGKSTLSLNLPLPIKQYDPAIKRYSDPPEPADIVVCTDVLEHIEPEYLEAVLDDLKRLVKKAGFFTVACVEAKKVLADGRNAHLIVESPEWWLRKLMERFYIKFFNAMDRECLVVVEPHA